MRINEIDVYTSQEILAFIEYLKVKAKQQKKNEDMQASYAGNLIGANFLNQGLGTAQATPEYMAKEVARKEAVAQLMAEAEKVQDFTRDRVTDDK